MSHKASLCFVDKRPKPFMLSKTVETVILVVLRALDIMMVLVKQHIKVSRPRRCYANNCIYNNTPNCKIAEVQTAIANYRETRC